MNTTVSASNICDATGTKIANATAFFTPSTPLGTPLPGFNIAAGGQATAQSVKATVTNGVLSVILQDTTKTNPLNIAYRFEVRDAGNALLLGPYVIQPSGATWSLDTYTPNMAPLALIQTGPQGPPGEVSAAALTAATISSSQSVLNKFGFAANNLLDTTKITAATYLSSTGAVTSFGSASCTDYLLVAGLQFISFSQTLAPTASAAMSTVFYDAAKTFISAVSTSSYPVGTPMPVAATAVYCRVSYLTANATLATLMIVAGSSVPGVFAPYKYTPPETTNLTREANAIASTVLALSPSVINLFDKTRVTNGFLVSPTTGALLSIGGLYYSSGYIPVIPGQTIYMRYGGVGSNPTYGLAYYDGSKAFVSGVPLPFTNGQSFSVPANVAFVRFSGLNTSGVTPLDGQMLAIGSLPASYVPFVQQQAGTPVAVTQATVSPLKGKRLGVWGDSISAIFSNAWQNVVLARGGCTLQFQDARPGRSFVQQYVFECYGGTPTGTNQGSVSTPNGNTQNTGTVGNTLAQDLANVDIMIVWLGTNDFSITLGAHGDAANAGTTYGNIRATIEALLTANPAMRLLMVTNQYRGDQTLALAQGVASTIRTVAADYAVPVLDMTTLSGCNSFTAATLLRDGIHPSTTAFSEVVGPVIAQFIQQYA